MKFLNWTIRVVAALALSVAVSDGAIAQDKVSVGVFPVSSSLPYFVAVERGFFKEANIEPEMTKLMGGPPNVAAMMTNQIEVSAVLVTLEGLNANVKKPGVAMYISLNSQTKVWKMEQFVVRNGFKAETIADLKGAKLMSAPGPANLNTAKAILAKNGLKEGDYTIDQLDMGQHINAMTAGTFDGGYTLEPNASMMIKAGVARSLEAGVISKYILGDEKADAYAAGCAMTSDFIARRPDVETFRHGLEQGRRLHQQEPRRGAQISRQEHVHPGQRGRYGVDARICHGQRHGRKADRRSAKTGRFRQFDRGCP
jgi:NitT/TauT family transport system substrate-binding protein